MNMSQDKPRTVETTVVIEASVEDVWKALTEAADLVRWFPLEAQVTPGVGGSFRLSWRGNWEWNMRTVVWEPGRHVRFVQEQTPPYDVEGKPLSGDKAPPVELTLDFFLTGEGGGTRLRVVHSGFGQGAAWDHELEGVGRGWNLELAGLRHYLRRHKGKDRLMAWARASTKLDLQQAWSRVTGPEGLAREGRLEGLREGERYRIRSAQDDVFEGRVVQCNPPWDFSGTVSRLDDSLLRVAADRFTGRTSLNIWLSYWGPEPSQVEAMERRWQGMLDALLGPAPTPQAV